MVVLAVVQGVTEFLPISSSAHLILVPHVLDWTDQGLGFDLAVHLGTLIAVLAYFRCDVMILFRAWIASMIAGRRDIDVYMAWGLILATLPAIGFGVLIGLLGEGLLRLPWIIATTSILFGVLLGVVDAQSPHDHDMQSLTWRGYIGVGLLQAVALIPGSSRSGMTIMAARAAGLTRPQAARLAFFLAIPVTAAAIAFEMILLLESPVHEAWGAMAVSAALACVSAFVTIHYFLRMLQSVGMMPFVAYRVVLGVVLFAVFGWSG